MRVDILNLLLEIDDDLDVAFPVLQRLAPARQRYAARDQAPEPVLVGARERVGRHLVMPAIGVDGAEHGVVVEHRGAVEATDIELEDLAGLGDPGQADDAGGGGRPEAVADHRRHAGALHQYVRRQPTKRADVGVIGAAELAHQRRFRTGGVVIVDVDVEIALHSHQGRQQPDRAGAGDEQRLRLPGARAPPNALGVVPGLGENAGGLEQDPENAQGRSDLDGEFRLDAEALDAVAVTLLDAALGVAPVAAHVPFPDGAGRARHRIGPPHDADHEVAAGDPAAFRRLDDLAQRFVAEHQALLAGRRFAIGAGEYLAIGSAHAEGPGAHQD